MGFGGLIKSFIFSLLHGPLRGDLRQSQSAALHGQLGFPHLHDAQIEVQSHHLRMTVANVSVETALGSVLVLALGTHPRHAPVQVHVREVLLEDALVDVGRAAVHAHQAAVHPRAVLRNVALRVICKRRPFSKPSFLVRSFRHPANHVFIPIFVSVSFGDLADSQIEPAHLRMVLDDVPPQVPPHGVHLLAPGALVRGLAAQVRVPEVLPHRDAVLHDLGAQETEEAVGDGRAILLDVSVFGGRGVCNSSKQVLFIQIFGGGGIITVLSFDNPCCG